jgi:predicted nucleic acid-binding protein
VNADRIVVDASVAVKWFVEEEHTAESLRVLSFYPILLAPSLLPVEVANALLKKLRRGEVLIDHVRESLERLVAEMTFVGSELLTPVAFEIAHGHGRSLYDAVYVALALREGCSLVTADERLHNALRDAYPSSLLWVGDVS